MRKLWLAAVLLCAGCASSVRDSVNEYECIQVRNADLKASGTNAVTVKGEIVNGCKKNLAVVDANFVILDHEGAQLETLRAVTENLDAGRTWKFETAPTRDYPDDRGPLRLQVGSVKGY